MEAFAERFENEQAAAQGLLTEATTVLTDAGVKFVVVGGWVPFLFHSARFGHPGTYDLDVLLHEDSLDDGSFDVASRCLLERGYLRAVKNQFQAHRLMKVRDEEFVFHVDFLNERAIGDSELQLVRGSGPLRSIYTKAMSVVFQYGPMRTDPRYPGLKFPSIETFIATKAAATRVKKRPRDAFDIHITVLDQDPEKLRETWGALVSRDQLFGDANAELLKATDPTQGDAIDKVLFVLEALGQQRPGAFVMPTGAQVHATFGFLASSATTAGTDQASEAGPTQKPGISAQSASRNNPASS